MAKRKRDPFTSLLPFDPPMPSERQWQRQILLARLAHYLSARPAPTQLPLLKLLPSLNNSQIGDRSIRFSEAEAATLLLELGAILEQNPYYLGRSRYRVTIPPELYQRVRANHGIAEKD